MNRIAVIYTVKSVLGSFEGKLRAAMPNRQLKVHNLLDEFLATDPSPDEQGRFTETNKKRLYNDILNAELTGADVIVVTCSTLTPTVMEIRPFIKTPIVAIDDAMAEEAVMAGNKIKVLATAMSTIEPTKKLLSAVAAKQGKAIFLDAEDNEPAYAAMRQGNMELHDRLVEQAAERISGYDAVVLAQASMAHLEASVQNICGCPVFSSPDRCIRQVKQLLEQMD
ncbi:MAG: aspartate/glutamate racemase family protein [Angelakisella sp.]